MDKRVYWDLSFRAKTLEKHKDLVAELDADMMNLDALPRKERNAILIHLNGLYDWIKI